MTDDSVGSLLNPERLAKLPPPLQKYGTRAFKQLVISQKAELDFRTRLRYVTFGVYYLFLVTFGVLNVLAAIGKVRIDPSYSDWVRWMGGGAFAPLPIKVAAGWVAPYFTKQR